MRDTVVLPDAYHALLLGEGLQCGVMKEIDIGDYEGLDRDGLRECIVHEALKYENQRQAFYQTLLLYDNLIIPTEDPSIDYSGMEESGISTNPIEDYLSYNPAKEEGHEESVEYLRAAVVPVIAASIDGRFKKIDPKADRMALAYGLYDAVLGIGSMGKEEERLVTMYLDKIYREDSMGLSREIVTKNFVDEIALYYTDLCWKLDISAYQEADLMDTGYDLTKLGCDSRDEVRKENAYGILRCAYGKLIHTLPGFADMREVLKLKKERKSEIKELKQEMANLERILASDDPAAEEKAFRKAVVDIAKARDALNKGLPMVERIGRFTSLLGVPVGAMEFFSNPFPGMPVGVTVSAVGGAMVFAEKHLEKRSKWIEVLR